MLLHPPGAARSSAGSESSSRSSSPRSKSSAPARRRTSSCSRTRAARRPTEPGGRGPGAVVLGVDTDVFLGDEPLGKPADRDGAEARLRELSGRTHEVLSGVCLLGPRAGEERSGVARSLVTFAPLDENVLAVYLASEEWRGRAGAYAIQGLGSILVEKVEGDFSNVVGLPIRLLLELAPELVPAR